MPETDPVAARLGSVAVPDVVKADVWDAFHQAATADDFAAKVKRLQIPDAVKADLWDLKQAAAPPVFTGTNQFDAQGHTVVRADEPTATNLAIWNEIGMPPGVSAEKPYGAIYDAVKQWVGAGPHAVVEGVKDVGAGNYAKGANQIVRGGAITAAPFYAPALARALVAAPLATATSAVGGTVAGMTTGAVAEEVGRELGLTEDQTALLKTAGEFGGGSVGAKMTPAQAYDLYEAVRHPWMTIGRGVGTAAEAGVAAYQARQAARAAGTAPSPPVAPPPAGRTPADASAARIDQIIQEGLAQGAARAPQMPAPGAPRVTAPTPAPAPAAPAVPASTSLWAGPAKAQGALVDAAQRAGYPLSPAELQAHWPAVQAGGPETAPAIVQKLQAARAPVAPVRRWGPAEAQAALEEAAARAGYPISGGELKVARPSVMASGPDAGPAVAAAHVERLQARVPGPAVETPVAVPPAVAPPPSAVSPPEPPAAPVSVVLPPARPAAPASAIGIPPADAPVATVPTRTAAASAPGLSGAKAEGLIWQAAERAGIERITPADVRAAAALVQQGVAPDAALAEQLSSGAVTAPRPAPTVATPPAMSGATAEGLVWQAANRLDPEARLALRDVHAAATLVQQGQTPEAALRIVQQGGSAPVDPAADLAARLGTPSPAESDAAIDARWRKGELKTPSAPTAARMKADADARLAAAQQPVAAAGPAPKRASRRAPQVAAPAAATATPQETEAYRGYLIRRNPVSNEMWVEKDGFRIGGAASAEDAKRTIEMLTAA